MSKFDYVLNDDEPIPPPLVSVYKPNFNKRRKPKRSFIKLFLVILIWATILVGHAILTYGWFVLYH